MPASLSLDSHIPVRWVPIIRLIWILFALLLLTGFILGVPALYAELQTPCTAEYCLPYFMTPVEADILREWGLSLELYAGFLIFSEMYLAMVFLGPALFIFWRKSTDWIGVLVSLAFLFIGFIIMSEGIRAFVRVNPSFFQLNEVLISVGIVLFLLIFFLFPDGRFVPRRLGYIVAFFSLIILLVPFLAGDGPRSASGNFLATAIGMSFVVLGFISQIYRYLRVSTPAQRQQTKWVVLGFICLFTTAMYWTVLAEFSTLPAGRPRLLFGLTALPQAIIMGFFPLSVVIAMMRYRLWDADLLIRRTLVYALLTGALLLVYFLSVVLVQGVVNGVTGREQPNQITIVLSTLLTAALFTPIRRRLQTFIDRRFYRRKYNAGRILNRFAASARDEVDLDELATALISVVDEAMQPNQVSLWLPTPTTKNGAGKTFNPNFSAGD